MIRDRGGIYGERFRERIANMGIEEVVIAPRSPTQNPYCKRLIGSIRRECLDQVIVLNEHHLMRIRHGPGTKGFLKAVGPMMQNLACWLAERAFWTAEDRRWYGELVGDEPGADLSTCEQLSRVFLEHVARHPAEAPDDLPDVDCLDDQLIPRGGAA